MTTEFDPDWRSPPGATVRDLIEERGLRVDELRSRLGLKKREMSLFLTGDLVLTQELAHSLSAHLGASKEFWAKREANYRKPLIRRHAVFSSCQEYRYTLERYWDNTLPRCLFALLNPSTADAVKDDPTNRRGINYAIRWGYGSCVFVNLFALRSTDPKALYQTMWPVGEDNDKHILAQASLADLIVLAWGNHGLYQDRGQHVLELLRGFDLHYLKITKKKQPWHPLYLAGDLDPIPWTQRMVSV